MLWLALVAAVLGALISSPEAQTTDPAIAPAPPTVLSPTPPTVPAVAPPEAQPAAVEPTPLPPVQSERAEAEQQALAPFRAAEPLPPVQPVPPQTGPAPMPITSQPSRPAANEPLVTIGRPDGRANFGDEGNRRAAQLRSMPPNSFTFDRATLRDVLRFLADDAGIPYVGIPEHSPQAQRLVTFRMTASPFAALESVARQNDIKLMYEDGVWFMRLNDQNLERTLKKEDANELVGVIYQLKFDPGDRVAFESNGAYQGGPGGTGSSQGGNSSQAVVSGGAGGNGQNSPSSPQLPLQNSQYVFTARAPKIVNDVRVMLGLKPLVYGTDGSVEDPEAMAGAQAEQAALPGSDGMRLSPDASSQGSAAGSVGMGAASQESGAGLLFPVYVPPQKPQVIYNGDNNVIWVVATRKQHKWVAEYLSKVDKPQDLIAIEVKFVETKKNPQTDIGINWQNTLGSGITVGGSAKAGVGGEYKFGFGREKNWGSSNFSSSSSGNSILGAISNAVINNQTNLTVEQILNAAAAGSRSSGSFSTNFSGSGSRTANIDFRGQSTTVPYEAVLSLDEVSVTLQAFMQDRDSSVVQYPRVLTINNREVAITSAENTPVNAGVTQTQSGSTATQTGTLGYLPIGTQINILPKVVGRKQIALTVAVTISSIVGTVPINLGTGFNEYPITTERVYNATLQVESGYTLAVGGLEKVDDRDTQGGVPVLKDIPGVGYFFKNKSKARNRTNLIIFLTPYVISDPARTPGISETPESIVPQRPGGPPQAPTFSPDGRLTGGDPAIEEAFAWLEYQLRYYRQVNEENLTNLSSVEKLQGVISVARVLLADLQMLAGNPPYTMGNPGGERVLRAETFLTDLNRALAAAQENLM